MQMTMRWFGDGKDTVSLEQIRQVPGVAGVVPALHTLPAGEVWPLDMILDMKKEIEAAGLTMECIESVNVHESIKLGDGDADKYIENYKECIRNLSKAGVKVICYNFMPVFDWTRTDLAMDMGNGATCLCYDGKQVEGKSPEDMFREIDDNSNGYAMPGWETERMGEIKELFQKYKNITHEDMWKNLKHFLEEIEDIRRFLKLVDSPYNGLTFCTGSLGASADNDLPAMIREVGNRIYFAHLRNVKIRDRRFNETSHLSSDGSLDMYEIVKALQEVGFDGYVRPDHGRMIWGEVARPGYGLYDRALGCAYLNGLWEAVAKNKKSE